MNFTQSTVFNLLFNKVVLELNEELTFTAPEELDLSVPKRAFILTKGKMSVGYSTVSVPANMRIELLPGNGPADNIATGSRIVPNGTVITFKAIEPTEHWSYLPEQNNNQIINTDIFLLLNGNAVTVQGRKLFLCEGIVTIDNVQHIGPVALNIDTSSIVTANSDCYGLYINT